MRSQQGIYSFNVESEEELRYLDRVARANWASVAPAAVRVNPNVDAKTHKYISTGKSENKFGVDFDRIAGTLCAGGRGVAEHPAARPADAHRLAAHLGRAVRRGGGEGQAAGAPP